MYDNGRDSEGRLGRVVCRLRYVHLLLISMMPHALEQLSRLLQEQLESHGPLLGAGVRWGRR
jgi:hypothetical protein